MNHLSGTRDIQIPEVSRYEKPVQHIHCPISAKIINKIIEYFPNTIDQISENRFQAFHSEISFIVGEQDMVKKETPKQKRLRLMGGLTNTDNDSTI